MNRYNSLAKDGTKLTAAFSLSTNEASSQEELSEADTQPSIFNCPHLPEGARRIYLIRHAQAERTLKLDPEITHKGYMQTKALQNFFQDKDLALIMTSELRRAYTTAQALQAYHPGVPLLIEPNLNEFHTVGNWKELSSEDVFRLLHEKMYKPDHFCGVGESPRSFHRRIAQFWEHIIQGRFGQNARNIAIVSHNDVIRLIVSLIFGVTEDQEIHFTLAYPHTAVSELWIIDRRADPALPDWITAIKYLCWSSFLQHDLITY